MSTLTTIQVDFKSQLTRQLGFLKRSAWMFDDGYADEAIRIAVCIRVLIHQTGKSTSLLTHLNAGNIRLASSFDQTKFEDEILSWFGFGRIHEIDGIKSFKPPTWHSKPPIFLPVSEWWHQKVVMTVPSGELSRKDVVLNAADKDGGAHVDAKLGPEYQALTRDGSLGVDIWANERGEIIPIPMKDGHLSCLRQMAFELLHSPELTNLAE